MKWIKFGTETLRREDGFLLGDNPPPAPQRKEDRSKAITAALTSGLLFATAAVYSYSRKVK